MAKHKLLGDDFRYMTTALPAAWKERLDQRAKEAGLRPSAFLRGIVADWYVKDCQQASEQKTNVQQEV